MALPMKIFSLFLMFLSILIVLIALYISDSQKHNNITICGQNISLTLFSRVEILLPRIFTTRSKQIYYGYLSGSPIVVKMFPSSRSCHGLKAECMNAFREHVKYNEGHIKTLVLCPDAKNIELLYQANVLQLVELEYATEILIKKMLLAAKGWPIPKLLAHCQNRIIEEYVGPSLSYLSLDSFPTRLKISASLLKLAETFTFKHDRFRFYLTDISPDNLAVGLNMDVTIVDLDNVIIVDKTHESDDPSWNRLHVSERWGDEDGFVFSTSDVCRHSLSDHNFFAVCQYILARSNILSDGLLENLPGDVKEQYPDLQRLTAECSQPKFLPSRIEAARQLIKLIESILATSMVSNEGKHVRSVVDG